MNTEKIRLDKMLEEKKISQKDYTVLSRALKRKTVLNKIHSTFILNPFQKIAGTKALFWGVITLVLTSFLGVKAKLYYFSPMSTINASVISKQIIMNPFVFLLGQNIVCWLVLAIFLFITAKIIQKNNVRIIDFFGTLALARFPTLLVTIYVMIIRIMEPSLLEIDMTKGFPIHFTLVQYIFSIPIIVLAIWQAVMYFYAYKESSGLTGKKLILSFLTVMVLAELTSSPLTTWFMR